MRNAARFIGLTAMVGMLATGVACRGNSNADDDSTTIDGGLLDDGGKAPDAGDGHMTVYQVQNDAMQPGTAVTLSNVVVTAIDTFGARVGSIYVQELGGGPFSGVFVFA